MSKIFMHGIGYLVGNDYICIWSDNKEGYMAAKVTDQIITGVPISLQMSKAREILNSVVIPRNELYAIRKRENRLSNRKIKGY